MFMWEIEDENLPVSLEIDKLRYVFEEIYRYNVEVFRIPGKRSHSKVSAKINEFISINCDSVEILRLSSMLDIASCRRRRTLYGLGMFILRYSGFNFIFINFLARKHKNILTRISKSV